MSENGSKTNALSISRLVQLGTLVSMVVGAVVFFETSTAAEERYELLASDREVGDLRTRLELVKLKIQRLRDIANVRSLTADEGVELRSLERERDILLTRLTETGAA